MSKRYLLMEYNWGYNDDWNERHGYEVRCEFECESAARAAHASLERAFWRARKINEYRDDLEIESLKHIFEDLNYLTLGSLNRPLFNDNKVDWYRDIKVPIDLNDDELLYFLELLGLSAYKILMFDDIPQFFCIKMLEDDEYLELMDIADSVVSGETIEELKRHSVHNGLTNFFEFDLILDAVKGSTFRKIPRGLTGPLETLSDANTLFEKLVRSNSLIEYSEEHEVIGVRSDYETLDDLGKSQMDAIDAIFALNELLKKPVFAIERLNVAEMDEIRKVAANHKGSSSKEMPIPSSKNEFINYIKQNGALNFKGSAEYLPSYMDNIPNILDKVIEYGQENNIGICDFSDNGLTYFPNTLVSLKNLGSLRLSDNYIGSIPSSVGEFSQLYEIFLDYNLLHSVPDSVGELKKLLEFSISNNRLRSVPNTIDQITRLRTLNLRNNLITTLPDSIGSLQKLRKLDVSGNPISMFPDSFSSLQLEELIIDANSIKHLSRHKETLLRANAIEIIGNVTTVETSQCVKALTLVRMRSIRSSSADFACLLLGAEWVAEHKREPVSLHLNGCKLRNLPETIARNTHVQSLDISDNKLNHISHTIENLSNLENLYASKNSLKDIPESFCKLSNLKLVELSTNLLNKLPASIGNLRDIKSLDLSNNHLTDLPDSIGGMNGLRELNLSENKLSEIPHSIGDLSKIQSLDLSNNNLTGLPASIGKLNGLYKLDISVNQLSMLPSSIGELHAFVDLDLSNNNLTELPDSIGLMNRMKKLDLSGNRLSELPDTFVANKYLKELDLSNNQLTHLPESIGQLSSLEKLYLDKNKIESLPESIKNLTSLTEIIISNNKLTSLPISFGSIKQLEICDLSNNLLNSLPATFVKLEFLRSLNLSHNKFRVLDEKFYKLRLLEVLNVEYNEFAEPPSVLSCMSMLRKN